MIAGAAEPERTGPDTVRRSTSAALLVLFVAGTFVSSAGLHGCPRHHHHVPGPTAVTSPSETGSAASAAAAGEEAPPGDPSGRTCTCLGDCQAGAASALHRLPLRGTFQPQAVARVAVSRNLPLLRSTRSEYFLPYPLGPPAA